MDDKTKDKWSQLEDELRQRREQEKSAGGGSGFSGAQPEDAPESETRREPTEAERRRQEALREFQQAADRVGNRLMDVSEQAGKKFMDLSERVGEQLNAAGGAAFEKAKVFAKQLLDRANEMAEQANKEAAKSDLDEMARQADLLSKQMDERLQQTRDRFSGRETKNTDSLLDGKDDFFARAKRFAEGDYFNKGAQPSSNPEIRKDPDYQPSKKQGTVPGFEDLDGDGNELFDDAILDEDTPKKKSTEGDDNDDILELKDI